MALPRSRKEAAAAVQAATEAGIAPFFLGNGSNLLVADHGYEGFVLKACGLDQVREVNRRLRAESGITLARLANAALGRGLTGLEFAHGIPGTLGGAVVMNAGAYGGEVGNLVQRTCYMDANAKLHMLASQDHLFGYRTSLFKEKPGNVVLYTEFKLQPGGQKEIQEKMSDYAARRREKQPLDQPSVGSVYKRPEGHYAGELIEQCGLKGYQIGGAMVSPKHAGFIVNTGKATASDVIALMEHIEEVVMEKTGVSLEREVRVVNHRR